MNLKETVKNNIKIYRRERGERRGYKKFSEFVSATSVSTAVIEFWSRSCQFRIKGTMNMEVDILC